MENNKLFAILGVIASGTSVAMYVSYLPQIDSNLNGMKGEWLQPLVAAVNCSLWLIYGIFKKPKSDWPIIIANFPGIVFGLITFFTAI